MEFAMRFVIAHWLGFSSVAGYLAAAAITAMYPPSKEPSFYGWFYHFTHALLPLVPRRASGNPTQAPGV